MHIALQFCFLVNQYDVILVTESFGLNDFNPFTSDVPSGAIKKLFPKAEVIFATSTFPLNLEATNEKYAWRVHNVESYNEAALEIIEKHGFAVNDLYEITKNAPKEYHSDRVHYYTKDGTRILTNKVVESIEERLKIRGKKLDFDALIVDGR